MLVRLHLRLSSDVLTLTRFARFVSVCPHQNTGNSEEIKRVKGLLGIDIEEAKEKTAAS